MIVYCTTRNLSPALEHKGRLRLTYLGTSVAEAEEAVGRLSVSQKPDELFPKNFREEYTLIPKILEPEMIQWFQEGGFWASIVMFELKEEK